jgi:ubiquitin-protein ligase
MGNRRPIIYLLGKIGFPRERIPEFGTPLYFWSEICSEAEGGVVQGGAEAIVTAAADEYPHNHCFLKWCHERSEPDNRNTEQVIISVTGHDDSLGLLALARQTATIINLPGQITLGFVRNDAIILELDQANTEQATQLAQLIETNNQQIQTSVAVESFRDYMLSSLTVAGLHQEPRQVSDIPASTPTREIVPDTTAQSADRAPSEEGPEQPTTTVQLRREGAAVRQLDLSASLHNNHVRDGDVLQLTQVIPRLWVEGPDNGRFELSNVPLTTPISDIARATMAEYDDKMWPQDRAGHARPAIVDRVNKDGPSERLDQHSTIAESNIRNGDTLHVLPESTAGSVNPLVREDALARVRIQILAYANCHPDFKVSANGLQTPTEYLFNFSALGWGPPSEVGGFPYPIDKNQVFIRLLADFPMQAPQAFWQSPIFHPNVGPKTGEVCLGALQEKYRPGMDFGKLCQLMVDIGGYQNYEVREYYNKDAAKWARSDRGQAAIIARGGKSLLDWAVDVIKQEHLPPPSLNIKRCQ